MAMIKDELVKYLMQDQLVSPIVQRSNKGGSREGKAYGDLDDEMTYQ